ncbi:hypothetical protein [Salinibius halmophilus]|uniref:hypothetical protein n=1 Tax=Salinibius halmophilus TaxID=1853216 RepID=UPI000E664792|nr:hypothetical protein [Salinibius halmophilus]
MINWLTESEALHYSEPLQKRFGMADDWLGEHRLLRFGSRRIYMANRHLQLPEFQDDTEIEGIGISLLRVHSQAVPKPTFEGSAYLLQHASKNVLALTTEEAELARSATPFSLADERAESLERGFILMHLHGVSFGCATFKDATVTSYFPKRYSHYNAMPLT